MVHDLLGQAYSSIKHNRRRTALTMLGMAWGIATVVILLAYGAGFGRAITAIFSNFGMQMMGVFPGRTSAGGRPKGGRAGTFHYRRRAAFAGADSGGPAHYAGSVIPNQRSA